MTHLRCGGKYDMSLVANLLLSPTVKAFLKSANISQRYERVSSGTFFMAHGVYNSYTVLILDRKSPVILTFEKTSIS